MFGFSGVWLIVFDGEVFVSDGEFVVDGCVMIILVGVVMGGGFCVVLELNGELFVGFEWWLLDVIVV